MNEKSYVPSVEDCLVEFETLHPTDPLFLPYADRLLLAAAHLDWIYEANRKVTTNELHRASIRYARNDAQILECDLWKLALRYKR